MWHTIKSGRFLIFSGQVQIGNLIFTFFFYRNLCYKYPNGSCEPILDIYVSITFKWYKEFFNPMSFDPWNCPLKIQESIRTPTPLGVCGFIRSHSPTLPRTWNVTSRFHFWPTPCKSCLGFKPKFKVATNSIDGWKDG